MKEKKLLPKFRTLDSESIKIVQNQRPITFFSRKSGGTPIFCCPEFMDTKQIYKSDAYSFSIMCSLILFDIRKLLNLLYHPTDVKTIKISRASKGDIT